MRCDFLEFSKETYDGYQKPLVYELFKGNDTIYVGHASYGLGRVFNSHSPINHPGRHLAFKEADRVLVSFFDLVSESSLVEEELIHRKHPKYNKSCSICNLQRTKPKFGYNAAH